MGTLPTLGARALECYRLARVATARLGREVGLDVVLGYEQEGVHPGQRARATAADRAAPAGAGGVEDAGFVVMVGKAHCSGGGGGVGAEPPPGGVPQVAVRSDAECRLAAKHLTLPYARSIAPSAYYWGGARVWRCVHDTHLAAVSLVKSNSYAKDHQHPVCRPGCEMEDDFCGEAGGPGTTYVPVDCDHDGVVEHTCTNASGHATIIDTRGGGGSSATCRNRSVGLAAVGCAPALAVNAYGPWSGVCVQRSTAKLET